MAECLAITTNVMTLLPREIRDMIYLHLSTRPHERVEKEQYRATLDPLTRLYSYDHGRWKASHFSEHYWDASYVGAPFFRELVESYYRTSTFIFRGEPEVMKRFLQTNEFGLPSLLPSDLVADVVIHLQAVSCGGQLQPLFELKPGASVRIHFLTEANDGAGRKRFYQDGVETLFSSAQREKLKRYRVQFVADERHVFDVESDLVEEWAGFHG